MTALTTNFDSSEFDVNEPVPVQYSSNVVTLAGVLQDFRDLTDSLVQGGSPVVITSCYRDPQRNATIPGAVSNSQHLTASAADVIFEEVSQLDVYNALLNAEANGQGPDYSQCIFYQGDPHVHIGIVDPSIPSGQKLLKNTDGTYTDLVANPGAASGITSTPPNPSLAGTIRASHCPA